MRLQYVLLYLVISVPLALFSQGDHLTSNPTEYNNFIVHEQDQLVNKIIEYNIATAHSDNYEENNLKCVEISRQLEISIEKIKALPPFKNDYKLQEEALTVFRLYKEAYDIEFNEVNLLRKDRKKSFEAMEKYFKALDKAGYKLKNGSEKFIKAQQEFAKKYKLSVKQSSPNLLADIIKVNEYSRGVFLEYYRILKKDEEFLNALNTQDAEAMEQKRKNIMEGAELSLSNLDKIIPYNNDSAYKVKAVELVNYHKSLAQNEYTELIAILKKQGRAKADVDRYNEIVNTVNGKSEILVSNFNKENREMLKRHIPMN
ncbi:MAG: hypothetical protein K2X86_01855 [Cytophagaceae bacterium]|nr:hypothetical protein [Cytophagaceae bacterium]